MNLNEIIHYDPAIAINSLWLAFFGSMAISFVLGAVVRIYFDVGLRYYKKLKIKA